MTLEELQAKSDADTAALETAQADLNAAADAVLAGVPGHLRALIPATMSPKERIDWFAQAKATGIFDRPAVATTDDGKPRITPKVAEPSSLPPYARMAAGYRK